MKSLARHVFVGAACMLCAAAAAQEGRTLEERVATLELELETLADRVASRGNVAPSPLGTPEAVLGGRVADLERSIDRFSADLQRLERQVDNAVRDAAEARRQAMSAERAARDAARIR